MSVLIESNIQLHMQVCKLKKNIDVNKQFNINAGGITKSTTYKGRYRMWALMDT